MKHEPHGPWYYEQIDLGYNYRITDIQCALIISQLDKIDIFAKRRKEIVERYNKAFSQIPEVFVQQEIPESDTTRHLYILRIKPELLNIDRKGFFAAMDAENISCNVHYQPVYFLPYYEELGYKRGICPNAEKLYNEIMSLPLYYSLTDKDVEDVILAVRKLVDYYRK
jgi:dTDP-4-amino-4,6-dideoxygalactose transaminase